MRIRYENLPPVPLPPQRNTVLMIRFPVAVTDRFVFRLPGFRAAMELMGMIEGTQQQCLQRLTPTENHPGA